MNRLLILRLSLCIILFQTATTAAETVPAIISVAPDKLQEALEHVSPERMMADIDTLSGPEYSGRQAGTEDDRRSAVWVRNQFTSSGLSLAAVGARAAPATGLMTSIMKTVTIEDDPFLSIGPATSMEIQRLGAGYLPILDSPSAELHAPIIFVGYGTLDDYAAIDVTDCIVLFLRGKPDHLAEPVTHADKVRLARSKGALAYLTAVGPVLNAYEARRGLTGSPVALYGHMPVSEAIPGAWISTTMAEAILAEGHHTQTGQLREIQEGLNKTAVPRSRRTDQFAQLRWTTQVREGLIHNVVALLPGTGPDTIVIGAHRDHFGRTAGQLFPGADDNASGTAVMLEVGRVLSETGWHPAQTLLFVSFSGEEADLLGARLYITRPAMPLSSTKAMINIDHAGIGNGRLTVGVTGLDKSLAKDAGHSAGLADKIDVFGFFPGGDHVPFKEAGVPTVTVVSAGVHPHFHQTTDSHDTINPEVLGRTARYVLALLWQLARTP